MGFVVGDSTRPLSWLLAACCATVCAACDPAYENEGANLDAGDASEDWVDLDTDGALGAADPRDSGQSAPTTPDTARLEAGTDAPAIAPPVDVCGATPTSGRCRGEHEIELCAIATGMSRERVETYACPADALCTEESGRARCVLRTACPAGTTRCTEGALETCESEHWSRQDCATECVETPLGAFCAAAEPTRRFDGRVQYERRLPDDTFSDWSEPTLAPARGFLVLSYHGEELVDAVLSGADDTERAGTFSVRVRAALTPEDSIVVMAAGAGPGQALAYAVADPGFEPSLGAREPGKDAERAAIWSYRFALAEVAERGALTIREQDGSPACHVFDRLRQVYTLAQDHYRPERAQSLIVWLGIGTQWSCGACTAWSPTVVFDTEFEHQLWLDGSSDEGYWSDPVTAHELGHYVMNAYGYPLGEGGPHYLGIPTHPGQAFSEGWATFFSSLTRADSRYFDKQGGAFFWWDLDRRAYSPRTVLWARALPWLGVLQLMDENEAAAIMWRSYQAIGGAGPVLDAIASDRMRVAPFARGYKRRIWSNPAYPDVFESTEQPLPCLADYLDALLCLGAIDAGAVSQIVEPRMYYPYVSESPLCN